MQTTEEEERQTTRKKCGLWISVAALCIAGLSIFAYLMFFRKSNSETECAANTNDPFQCPVQHTNDGDQTKPIPKQKKRSEEEANAPQAKPIRLICISDTHDEHEDLTQQLIDLHDPSKYNDFLIHAGDMTDSRKRDRSDLKVVNEWFGELPFEKDHIIVIAGNNDKVDLSRQSEFYTALDEEKKKELFSSVTYLEDSSHTIDGIHFYGTPWTTPHSGVFQLDNNGDRELDEKKQKATWAKIPEDVNVLIVHQPPYEILDEIKEGTHEGDEVLAKEIKEREKLKVVVFGHIHPAWGEELRDGIKYVNAAQKAQHPKKPIVIYYDEL